MSRTYQVMHVQAWKNRLASDAHFEELRRTVFGDLWRVQVRCNSYVDQAYAKLQLWTMSAGWQDYVVIPMRLSAARVPSKHPDSKGNEWESPYWDAMGDRWDDVVEQMKLGATELWTLWDGLISDYVDVEGPHSHDDGTTHEH